MGNGNVILITGTSRGIGKYLSQYYAQKGFQVIGCSRSPSDLALDNYQHFEIDISQEDQVRKMFWEIKETRGRLDFLINNAGIMATNLLLLTSTKSAQEIFQTNVMGTFLFCRESAKLMKTNNFGRIVNISSISVVLKIVGEAIYAASKAAIITLTQVLAKELASYNITVNALNPNPLKTEIISEVPSEKIQEIIKQQSIPRLGEFRDISNVIDFFFRNESDFITGQVITLGGL